MRFWRTEDVGPALLGRQGIDRESPLVGARRGGDGVDGREDAFQQAIAQQRRVRGAAAGLHRRCLWRVRIGRRSIRVVVTRLGSVVIACTRAVRIARAESTLSACMVVRRRFDLEHLQRRHLEA